MPARGPLTGVLLFYGAVVTAALLLMVARWPSEPGGSPAEPDDRPVDASLVELARRVTVNAPDTTARLQLTLYRSGPSEVRGLLVATERDSRFEPSGQPETQLALRFRDTEGMPASRSPADPMQSVVELERLDRLSDLPDPHRSAAWPTHLALELGVAPDARLHVDNRARCLPPATAPGTLDLAGTPWFHEATDAAQDQPRSTARLRTMDLLSRMLRARICTASRPISGCRDTLLLIQPAPGDGDYLLELGPLDPATTTRPETDETRLSMARWSMARWSMAITVDSSGGLDKGVLRVVEAEPRPDDLLISLFVTRPAAPGEMIDPTAAGLASLHLFPGRHRGRTVIDLATLLEGTAWLHPEAGR